VRQLVQKAGVTGINRSQLLRSSHLRKTDLDEVVAFLKETEEVVEETGSAGRRTRVYKSKKFSSSHLIHRVDGET